MAYIVVAKKDELRQEIESGKCIILSFISNDLDIKERNIFEKKLSLVSTDFEEIEFINVNVDQDKFVEVYNEISASERMVPMICGFKNGKTVGAPTLKPSAEQIIHLAENLTKNVE